MSFKVTDNVGVSEVYIKLMTAAGNLHANFATPAPIAGTYDPNTQTASVSVNLTDLNILSDLYYITCYGKDASGNESAPLRSKEPISPFFISSDSCGKYKAVRETPILNYPGTAAYPGANRETGEKIAKGEKADVLGTITIDGVNYHRIEAETFVCDTGSQWVKADDMEYYESLITKIMNWLKEHATEMICFFGRKVISLGEDGNVVQSGRIITSAKDYFSPAYVESLADSGTSIIPKENTEYSIEFKTVDGEITITIAEYLGYGGDVTVPAEIGGFRVATIKDEAFSNCSNIMSISLPEGITSIPNKCFENCISLTQVVLPETVRTIGSNAFYGCKWLENLTIPDSVENIYSYAFCGCSGLTSITIPISTNYHCGNGYGEYASFEGCTNVCEIHYTKGNGEVMQYTVNGSRNYCLPYIARENLTTVTLEEGITEIPERFLDGCSSVNTVYLPCSIETISAYAFNQCADLSDIYFNGSELEANGILINSNNTDLNTATWHYALENPDDDLSLKLPGQLKVIEEEAFTGISAEVIIIPSTIETIKSGSFTGCANLKAILFEGSPETIENDIVTNPEDVTVFVIKDSNTEAWAHDAGFRVKYNLGNN